MEFVKLPTSYRLLILKPSHIKTSTFRRVSTLFLFTFLFSADKKYYTPKYRYYGDDFYRGYGIIDWKPELTSDSNGIVTLKVLQPEVPVSLFIEGIANDGSFIFEEKTISLN
jgi:hypothetical protein